MHDFLFSHCGYYRYDLVLILQVPFSWSYILSSEESALFISAWCFLWIYEIPSYWFNMVDCFTLIDRRYSSASWHFQRKLSCLYGSISFLQYFHLLVRASAPYLVSLQILSWINDLIYLPYLVFAPFFNIIWIYDSEIALWMPSNISGYLNSVCFC